MSLYVATARLDAAETARDAARDAHDAEPTIITEIALAAAERKYRRAYEAWREAREGRYRHRYGVADGQHGADPSADIEALEWATFDAAKGKGGQHTRLDKTAKWARSEGGDPDFPSLVD